MRNIDDYFVGVNKEANIIFIMFVLFFVIVNFIMVPRVLRNLNETTWRSRGILNLVPYEIFKEMRSNSEVLKMLKS